MSEQRYQAVLAVIAEGRTVTEAAGRWGVSRQILPDSTSVGGRPNRPVNTLPSVKICCGTPHAAATARTAQNAGCRHKRGRLDTCLTASGRPQTGSHPLEAAGGGVCRDPAGEADLHPSESACFHGRPSGY